jgi:thymidylate synthase (FAD)
MMEVRYISHMGTDLQVVNAARVSFNKHKQHLEDGGARLIRYLAKHGHWTPFAHTAITLAVKAPVFVRTQAFKHKIGFVENEVSRRYVDTEPSFYYPVWRGRSTTAKQGSTPYPLEGVDKGYYDHAIAAALLAYKGLLAQGVAPEQARCVLPQSMYTEWYWTGSLVSYARFYSLRSNSLAQLEIQELAAEVAKVIEPLFPISWKELIHEHDHPTSRDVPDAS